MRNHFSLLVHRNNFMQRAFRSLFAVAVAGFAVCGFSPELAAQGSGGRVAAQSGFSFVPPAGWEPSSMRPSAEVKLLYLGPSYGGGRANLNLIIQQDDGESFDDIAKQIKLMYPKLFTAWKFIEDATLEIDGKKTYYLLATHRMGSLTLRQAQFIVRGGNGKIYILSFAVADDVFARFAATIAQSAMSIRIQ